MLKYFVYLTQIFPLVLAFVIESVFENTILSGAKKEWRYRRTIFQTHSMNYKEMQSYILSKNKRMKDLELRDLKAIVCLFFIVLYCYLASSKF